LLTIATLGHNHFSRKIGPTWYVQCPTDIFLQDGIGYTQHANSSVLLLTLKLLP